MGLATSGTLDLDGEERADDMADFVSIARQHGLIGDEHADLIVSFANEHDVHASDAALRLSILQTHEVEAVGLLSNPKGLAPGYELTGLLGCGAAGMVFRARQIALDRDVALKTIHPQVRQGKATAGLRIQREAHAIARLQHPGIVSAIDSGFYQGRFCITMELVKGETLVEFIEKNSAIPELTAWQLARQVAYALAHASDHGIVHRDIKPANLLLCDPPTGTSLPSGVPLVKVADFGLAFDDHSNQITATGVSLGTPAYVAPEQLRDTHVDQRADIYSLGATVFHLLTGFPPCTGHSPMRTIMRKSIGDESWRDELDRRVSSASRSLFLEMTEADLDARISTYEVLIERIDQLIADLDSVRDHQSHDAKATQSVASARSASRRRLKHASATSGLRPNWMGTIRYWIGRRSILIWLFGVIAILATGGGLFFVLGNSDPVPAGQLHGDQWVVDGFPEPLFNGSSVPLFRQSGSWLAGSAADGSRVLVGKEGARMTIPLRIDGSSRSNVRFRVAVNLSANASAELAVFSEDANEPIARLQISQSEARFDSPLTLGKGQPNQILELPTVGESGFQQVLIYRETGRMRFTVNGVSVGTIGHDSADPVSVQLRSKSGLVNFADMDKVMLTPILDSSKHAAKTSLRNQR